MLLEEHGQIFPLAIGSLDGLPIEVEIGVPGADDPYPLEVGVDLAVVRVAPGPVVDLAVLDVYEGVLRVDLELQVLWCPAVNLGCVAHHAFPVHDGSHHVVGVLSMKGAVEEVVAHHDINHGLAVVGVPEHRVYLTASDAFDATCLFRGGQGGTILITVATFPYLIAQAVRGVDAQVVGGFFGSGVG